MYSSNSNLAGYYDNRIEAENMTLGEYIDKKLDKRPRRLDDASLFIDTQFKDLMGQYASAITVERTFIILVA